MSTFQRIERRERRRFSDRFRLTAFSVNVFFSRKSSFKFDTINQLDLTRFNTQNIVNQIIQKFYDTTFKDKRSRRQSMTSSIIESDIDDSEKKYQNASSKSSNRHVTSHDRDINLLFFSSTKSEKISHFKNFKRLTLNFIEETKEEKIFKFHFIDENENREYIVDDVEDLRTQVNQKLDNWMNNLNFIFNKCEVLVYQRTQVLTKVNDATVKLDRVNRQIEIHVAKVTNLKNDILNLQVSLKKFRQLVKVNADKKNYYKNRRDQHRTRNDNYSAEILNLRKNKKTLKKQVQEFETKMRNVKRYVDDYYIDDSDNERRFRSYHRLRTNDEHKSSHYHRHRTNTSTRRFSNYQRFQTKVLTRHLLSRNQNETSLVLTSIHHSLDFDRDHSVREENRKNKTKYLDSSMFADNRIEWNSWKQNLLTKIWTCEYDFLFERHKINYVRDKCKDIVYKIIKHRIVIDSDDSYRILSKFIADLDNVFEKFDENSKTISELYSKNFSMKAINKNKNEIFDEFLTKFSAAIVDLRFDDEMKISHLRRIMTNKFNYDTKHLTQCKDYRFFCNEVREMSRLDKNMNDKRKMNSTRTTIISIVFKMIKFLQRMKSISSNRFNEFIERFSFHVQIKLQTKNKCFKCFKSSHRKSDVDASCKNDSKSTRKITEIEFVVIDIKWNDNDAADYETNLKKNATSDYENETTKHQKN